MNSRRLTLFVLTLLASFPQPVGAQGDLSRFRDKDRLLLIFAPSATDTRWVRQDARLARSGAPFSDRDLLRFDIFARGQSQGGGLLLKTGEAAALRGRYHVRPGDFRVLLIGKDGHVAFSGAAPISLGSLTGRIDRMPMRQDEVRRRGRRAG